MVEPGSPLPRTRRSQRLRVDLFALFSMVVVAVVLVAVVVSDDGSVRNESTWPLLGLVAVIVLLASMAAVVLIRRRPTVEAAPEPLGTRPAADDDSTISGAPPPAWEVIDADARWIELHPSPLWSRRLAEHPDALWLMADKEQMNVPGWLLEGRPRTIDKLARVAIFWSDIERLRVVAGTEAPDTYEITRRTRTTPQIWRVRRREIHDELTLLDHARSVGRVTIELEDSISSG